MDKEYDVIVVGAGPAGMTAAIYAVRAGKKTLMIEKGIVGGQIAWANNVENYPGFVKITGMELAKNMFDQTKAQGVEFLQASVSQVINVSESEKEVVTDEGNFKCKAVVLGVGRTAGKLNVPGAKQFEGKGIHYCAMCDAPLYKGKVVAVVGGGDSALKEALFLADIAQKVFVIHRRDELRAEKTTQDKAQSNKKIEFILSTEVKEFVGTQFLEKIVLVDKKNNKTYDLPLSAVFVYIGHTPSTDIFEVEKNEKGFVKVDHKLMTNIKGIFSAGDCIEGDIAQIATAVGDGAIAGANAAHYVDSVK